MHNVEGRSTRYNCRWWEGDGDSHIIIADGRLEVGPLRSEISAFVNCTNTLYNLF